MTNLARSSDFQRSLLALRYFWGARGEALADAFEGAPLEPAASQTLAGLCAPERADRAKALASELGRLSRSLEARALGTGLSDPAPRGANAK